MNSVGALSFDVRGARKLIRQLSKGLSLKMSGLFIGRAILVVVGLLTGFLVSAPVFVRMLHLFVWLQHGLLLYLDDGLLLVPAKVAPLVAAAGLVFLTALGVPLSLEEVRLGDEISWLGCRFSLCLSAG